MKGDEMKMKKLVVLLASGALVLALASCGKKAEEPAPAAPAMGGATTAAPAAPAMGGSTTAAPAPAPAPGQ
jgi:ABC-type phosphate transport system substrate-binding protein